MKLMMQRSGQDRRRDNWTAERFDLAVLTARAFDLHAAECYLQLSGISSDLVHRFRRRYPFTMRPTIPMHTTERRRARPVSEADPDQS
jgi:hypothetical protein